ncbi:MAG: hypothetical protein WC661_22255, partial [Opitutaceae bacterium]
MPATLPIPPARNKRPRFPAPGERTSRSVPSDQRDGPRGPSSFLLPSIGFAPIITFVLWAGCLLVGGLGYALPYSRPQPPAPEPAPVTAEKLVVELTADPLPATDSLTPPDPLAPPPSAPPLPVAPP